MNNLVRTLPNGDFEIEPVDVSHGKGKGYMGKNLTHHLLPAARYGIQDLPMYGHRRVKTPENLQYKLK